MALSDDAKKARAAYHAEWQKKNPDKVKEYCHRYWEKKAKRADDGEKASG